MRTEWIRCSICGSKTRFWRERNLCRSDERNMEQSELTEETLCRRAEHKQRDIWTEGLQRVNRNALEQVFLPKTVAEIGPG